MTIRKFRVAPDVERVADDASRLRKQVERFAAKLESAKHGLKKSETRLKRAKTIRRKYIRRVNYYEVQIKRLGWPGTSTTSEKDRRL